MGHSPLEIPQIAPLQLLYLSVASCRTVTLGHDSSLDGAIWGAKVQDGVSLFFVDGADKARPKERFFVRSVRCKLRFVLLCWCLAFLHCKVAIFLINGVWLITFPCKDFARVPLCDLAKMTPTMRVPRNRTLQHVWARCNHIGFFSRFGLKNPVTEGMYIAETFWASWLNHDQNATITQSLPKCLDDKLSLCG